MGPLEHVAPISGLKLKSVLQTASRARKTTDRDSNCADGTLPGESAPAPPAPPPAAVPIPAPSAGAPPALLLVAALLPAAATTALAPGVAVQCSQRLQLADTGV